MEKEKWYSFAEASRRAGKSRAYFYSIKANHPEYFQDIELTRIGNYFAIKESDLEKVLQKVKKAGDRLRAGTLKAVCKTKQFPLFLPNVLLYQNSKLLEVLTIHATIEKHFYKVIEMLRLFLHFERGKNYEQNVFNPPLDFY